MPRVNQGRHQVSDLVLMSSMVQQRNRASRMFCVALLGNSIQVNRFNGNRN